MPSGPGKQVTSILQFSQGVYEVLQIASTGIRRVLLTVWSVVRLLKVIRIAREIPISANKEIKLLHDSSLCLFTEK